MRATSILLGWAALAYAAQLPTGTALELRLKTKVSSQTSKPGDVVEAVLIAPVVSDGRIAIPAGSMVQGTVGKALQAATAEERSALVLRFDEVECNGAKFRIAARLASVDNARETVDEHGEIQGILASDTVTGRLDANLDRVSEKYSGLGGILQAMKSAVLSPADTGIAYDAGVELEIRLTAPLTIAGQTSPPAPAIPRASALAALVAREPFQTAAQNPPMRSDFTNILLIGDLPTIQLAFADAGWTASAALNGQTKFETMRAVAEGRGYSEAPVSILLLDGKPPAMVFEKLNNTFARRHHLRVWRRPHTFLGKPVWAVAATHDIGIEFSEASRTFIHRVDSQIDGERAKVVNDLIFTGYVAGFQPIDRPRVPRHGQNATGDNLETDGKIVALLLSKL